MILERVDVSCVWEVSWRRGQTATYWPKVLLTIAALLLIWAGLLNRRSLRAQIPSVCCWLSRGHLVPNWPNCNCNWNLTDSPKPSVAPGYIIVWRPPASCGRTHLSPSPNSTTSTGQGGCPRGVVVKAMDCGIEVRQFVLQSHYYVHFRANTIGKGMNPLILPDMG